MSYFLDNGAYAIKFGLEGESPLIRQNCIASIKREIVLSPQSLVNASEVLRPYDRGVMVDAELQLKIWKTFFPLSSINSLVYTCPLYTPATCRRLLDELIYEDLMIGTAMRVPIGPCKNCILVDLGFSACTIIPIYNSYPINYAMTRVNVGGKLLTNFMKEQISYRYFDMTEETWLVNVIREQMCYTSSSFLTELRLLQHKKIKEKVYVLPEHGDLGYPATENEDLTGKQLLNLSNLAIAVPELLFHPSDAGINCGGIHEALLETVNKLPKAIANELLSDIILIGGVANTKGLIERFTQEVQENVSVPIKVTKSDDSILHTWNSLAQVDLKISKKEYEEMGTDYIDNFMHYC